jgi:hypothetical protein
MFFGDRDQADSRLKNLGEILQVVPEAGEIIPFRRAETGGEFRSVEGGAE